MRSDGYGLASDDEESRLCQAASEFSRLRIDGLVLGFVRSGRIDVVLTQRFSIARRI